MRLFEISDQSYYHVGKLKYKNQILKNGLLPQNINDLNEEQRLDEVGVLSSWIQDLTYKNGDVIMTLLNGRSYRILAVPEGVYRWWIKAPSKGKFWHSHIRGNYRVSRL